MCTLEDEGVALFDELESLLHADNGLGALAQPVKNRYLMCDIKTKNNLKHVRSEQDLPSEFFLCDEGACLSQYNLQTGMARCYRAD